MVIKHFFSRERNQIRFHNCVQIIFRKPFYLAVFQTFQSLSITLQIAGLKINTNAEVFFPMLTTTDSTTDVYVGNYQSSYFSEHLQSAATARQYSYLLRFRSCFLVFSYFFKSMYFSDLQFPVYSDLKSKRHQLYLLTRF